MRREPKAGRQGAAALCSLFSAHPPEEGPLIAHDCLWDLSKGSRRQSPFSFGGKPIHVSTPPCLSEQNSHPFNHKCSGHPCLGLRFVPSQESN